MGECRRSPTDRARTDGHIVPTLSPANGDRFISSAFGGGDTFWQGVWGEVGGHVGEVLWGGVAKWGTRERGV